MRSTKCSYYCYRDTRNTIQYNNKQLEKIELVVFDMDGVITDTISSWKFIHDYFGSSNERSVDDYLKGKINDMEFIKRDVSLWKENGLPVTKQKLVEILSEVPLMRGAEKCMSYLKKKGVKTGIISAGLDILADDVALKLGIDHIFANGIKTDEEGRLTGEGIIGVRLMYKDESVKKLSEQAGVPFQRIAAVGNSCFDIPMLNKCGLGIAFNPEDDCVREAADIVIEGKDLSKILSVIESYIS
jgi:phosphoserine phosphatase